MSHENVELLRLGLDVWNRRDLDAALAGSHADVEITPVRGPAATTYRGHEGMRRFWRDIIGTFPDFSTEVVEARDLGHFVLGIVRIRGQGTGSEVSSEQTVWFASEWRDRKLRWYRACESEADALEAVQSREEATSQGNVDLVRRYFAAALAMGDRAGESTGRRLSAVDFPEASEFFEEYWHSEAVFDVSARLDGGIYYGPGGVEQSVREWLAAWEEFEIDFKEYLSAG